MSEAAWEVPAADRGVTLAAFVRSRMPELSWSRAKALCRGGRVRVDDQAIEDDTRRMEPGERVEVLPEGGGARRDDGIRYLDDDIVVAVKPAGVLTVPFEDGDVDTFWHRVLVAVKRREKFNQRKGSPTLRAVQRLDKETSGVMVLARTTHAQRTLQEALKEDKLERIYTAVVLGGLQSPQRYESWLIADRGDGLRGSWEPPRDAGAELRRPSRDARHAVTEVEPLRRRGQGTRVATEVRCRLATGRTHQIRIHLSEAGHPVLGDRVYGRGTSAFEWPGPMMLHAGRLVFAHPRTGKKLEFDEPPPPEFEAALEAL